MREERPTFFGIYMRRQRDISTGTSKQQHRHDDRSGRRRFFFFLHVVKQLLLVSSCGSSHARLRRAQTKTNKHAASVSLVLKCSLLRLILKLFSDAIHHLSHSGTSCIRMNRVWDDERVAITWLCRAIFIVVVSNRLLRWSGRIRAFSFSALLAPWHIEE